MGVGPASTCSVGLRSATSMLHSSRLQFLLLVSAVTAAVDAREQPTLAYLFTLRRARHPLPHAWANYFAGCPRGSYKIHIHVDPMFNGTAASEIGAAAKYFKQDFVLPRDQLMKVRRFGHELVLARMKLVRHALADKSAGGTPRFLSFFSESCAPISTCMRAHAYLASGVAANKSFIDDKRPKPPEQVRGCARFLLLLHAAIVRASAVSADSAPSAAACAATDRPP